MRNLLITTAGDYSHFDAWHGEGRSYDLHVIDYRTDKGYKYPLIYKHIKKLPQYDYYWMPDEDIYLTTPDINRLFDEMYRYGLNLGQPSVEESDTSFPSWRVFVHDPARGDLVQTNFVEIMCPCFSRLGLQTCLETFPKSNSGWGLDLVWAKLLRYNNMGCINSVVVKHTRKPMHGSSLYRGLTKQPGVEMKELMKEYKIPIIDVKRT